jgi:Leucine-rich repeat (LRR) protein
LGQLQALRLLEVPSNKIKNFPESIQQLQQLTGLYLSKNPITREHLTQLRGWLPRTDVQY